jgi:pimeloyl-ACP methyl ester carboxylesterase
LFTATTTACPIHHRVHFNGITLAVAEYPCKREGNGAGDLILVHGIGSTGASWWPVIDQLSRHFRLFVPDLRGHGASGKPASGYLAPDYAADLEQLLTAFNIDRPLLLGHSLGGLVCLTWATSNPERATAIAIEDSPLRGGPQAVPRFDEWIAMAQMSADQLTAYYVRKRPDWSGEDCRRRAEAMSAVALAVFQEMREASLDPEQTDRIEPLSVIRSPVLMVHGDLESGGMVVPDDVSRFTASLPNAHATRLPGAGHSLHRDHPDAFLDAVLPFLLSAVS